MLVYVTPRSFLICVRQLNDRYIDGASFSGRMNERFRCTTFQPFRHPIIIMGSLPPGLRLPLDMDTFYDTHDRRTN